MKRLSTLLFISIALVLVIAPFVPSLSFAQVKPPVVGVTSSIGGLKGFACGIAGWVFTVAIILSIIVAILTGIQYMTAGGDPEKFKAAHKKLLYIVVGIAVALIARTLPVVVNGVLRGSNTNLDACSGQYQ